MRHSVCVREWTVRGVAAALELHVTHIPLFGDALRGGEVFYGKRILFIVTPHRIDGW